MPPTILNDISQLTKEGIADLYFQSIGNIDTKKNHVVLTGAAVVTPIPGRPVPPVQVPPVHVPTGTPPVPKEIDLELDFTLWYGGVLSLAHTIDPGVDLPRTREMCQFIVSQFERVKSAMAA